MNDLKRLTPVMCMLVSGALSASDGLIDGTSTLLCAATESIQCTEQTDCDHNPPEANNIPRFARFDIANKKVSAVWPAGLDKASQIATVVNGESKLILQGVDGEVPWSVSIDKRSGQVVVSQTRGTTGFLIFGACMPE